MTPDHIDSGELDTLLRVALEMEARRAPLDRPHWNGPRELDAFWIASLHRIASLITGADENILKPVSSGEPQAQAESVSRRRGEPQGGAEEVSQGLIVDEVTREVRVNGRPISLTVKEFDLLAFLVRSPGQVFSRKQLLEHVWGSRPEWQDEAIVIEHVRRVRRKVEHDPEHPRWITSVRGVGWRFDAAGVGDAARPSPFDLRAYRTHLTEERLESIERGARERRTLMDRVMLELVGEIRRLRAVITQLQNQ
jgi:DNA-binding winged helix-turn-helix (wHTH) protein